MLPECVNSSWSEPSSGTRHDGDRILTEVAAGGADSWIRPTRCLVSFGVPAQHSTRARCSLSGRRRFSTVPVTDQSACRLNVT